MNNSAATKSTTKLPVYKDTRCLKEFGDWLAARRVSLNLSQDDAARRTVLPLLCFEITPKDKITPRRWERSEGGKNKKLTDETLINIVRGVSTPRNIEANVREARAILNPLEARKTALTLLSRLLDRNELSPYTFDDTEQGLLCKLNDLHALRRRRIIVFLNGRLDIESKEQEDIGNLENTLYENRKWVKGKRKKDKLNATTAGDPHTSENKQPQGNHPTTNLTSAEAFGRWLASKRIEMGLMQKEAAYITQYFEDIQERDAFAADDTSNGGLMCEPVSLRQWERIEHGKVNLAAPLNVKQTREVAAISVVTKAGRVLQSVVKSISIAPFCKADKTSRAIRAILKDEKKMRTVTKLYEQNMQRAVALLNPFKTFEESYMKNYKESSNDSLENLLSFAEYLQFLQFTSNERNISAEIHALLPDVRRFTFVQYLNLASGLGEVKLAESRPLRLIGQESFW